MWCSLTKLSLHMGKNPGNCPWGWGSRAGTPSPPFPGLNLLSSLTVSTMNTMLLHFLNSATVGKGGREGALGLQPSRCKAQEHAGLETLMARSSGGPYAGANGRAPAEWLEHMESDTAQSSRILLRWAQHHL